MDRDGQFIRMTREEFRDWVKDEKVSRKISMIQNHHTYRPNYAGFNGRNHFDLCKGMRNYHMTQWKFPARDIAQNITTFSDGMIVICRPLWDFPAGIFNQNREAICIEHVGNFHTGGDNMSEEHKKTIIFINAVLAERLRLPIDVQHFVYHHWYDGNGVRRNGANAQSTCPGANFFGGNKVPDADREFIPLIKNEFVKLTVKEVIDMGRKIFKDTEGRWSDNDVLLCSEKGIVKKAENFRPMDAVTREENAAMFARLIRKLEGVGIKI